MNDLVALKSKRSFYVTELFGPTIQGEGPQVGQLAHFVRFGGCDYRCSWCDSMHAVDPKKFKRAPQMTAKEISDAIDRLPFAPWVILSGGNPALFDLHDLVKLLQAHFRVACETQGSRWQEWMAHLDQLVVSPKPPSSGMTTDYGALDEVMRLARFHYVPVALKVPCFDRVDLEFAVHIARRYPDVRMFVSVVALAHDDTESILWRTRELVELSTTVVPDVIKPQISIFPQQHVLLWGHEKGR